MSAQPQSPLFDEISDSQFNEPFIPTQLFKSAIETPHNSPKPSGRMSTGGYRHQPITIDSDDDDYIGLLKQRVKDHKGTKDLVGVPLSDGLLRTMAILQKLDGVEKLLRNGSAEYEEDITDLKLQLRLKSNECDNLRRMLRDSLKRQRQLEDSLFVPQNQIGGPRLKPRTE